MQKRNRHSPPLSGHCTFISNAPIIRTHIDSICGIETDAFDPPWKRDDFSVELERDDAHAVILLLNERLIGYLFARIALDEVHLNKLCIRAEYRGRGYGRLLLHGFLDRMKGRYARLFLEVERTNAPAVGLYAGTGFRINRIRKGVYASGADALEMVLDAPQIP